MVEIPERICKKCNSIISSRILEQCPICMEILPSLDTKSTAISKKKEIIKYLIKPDKKIKPDYTKWTIKEAGTIFSNSFLLFILFESIMLIIYTIDNPNVFNWVLIEFPITQFTLYINQIPFILLAVPPIYYIIRNKLSFEKIGIKNVTVKGYIIYGIIACIILGGFDYLFRGIMSLLENEGWSALSQPNYIYEQNQVIQAMKGWVVFYIVVLVVREVAEDILFRGVLQNALDIYYSKKNDDKLTFKIKTKSTFMVSAIYSLIFYLLSFSIFALVINLVTTLLIGFFYESSEKSMITLISLRIFYTTIVILLLFL